ncbi:MAG: D-2-hydroxyacid dehydrogenase [Verrucomicrobia bacterium]|nr:D-2-hydroxyacid dehydrogenase [Verrucomicrobiota bacterium]
MDQKSSVIWTNLRLAEPELDLFRAETKDHQLIIAAAGPHVLAENAGDPQLAAATIVFGQPSPEDLLKSKNLRWLHVSSAGYTRYDRKDLFDHFSTNKIAFTNSSSVFSEPCAEHALAVLLAETRQLYPSYLDELHKREWQQNERRAAASLLSEQTILIAGFGSIGQRLAEFLKPFGSRIIGVRRRPRPSPGVSVLGLDDVKTALPEADHVMNFLPENSETIHFFDKDKFSRCRPGACYYSLGRGTTTDQNALIVALKSGQLRAAYLDVTDPEPLPPDHPLWFAPNCYITPHSSGGHHNESLRLTKHFLANLRRFENGEPLIDRII